MASWIAYWGNMPDIYIYIYIYILESTGALRAPLILRMPLFVSGPMTSKVAVRKTWGLGCNLVEARHLDPAT